MTAPSILRSAIALACGTVLLTSPLIAQSASDPNAEPPRYAPPDPDRVGPDRPRPDMQRVLNVLGTLGGRPIENLTPAEARRQPTPTDAVKRIMAQRRIPMDNSVRTQERQYGDHRWQKVRIYTPATRGRG